MANVGARAERCLYNSDHYFSSRNSCARDAVRIVLDVLESGQEWEPDNRDDAIQEYIARTNREYARMAGRKIDYEDEPG